MDLEISRTIERLNQSRPIINPADFPHLDLYERSKYREELAPYNKKTFHDHYCRAYVRTAENGEWFVDVYFIENFKKAYMRTEHRFVIKSGFLMSQEDEYAFLKYLHRVDIFYGIDMADDFIEKIKKVAPEFNITGFTYFPIVLEHTYFAAARSGIRELLYKAGGLNEIAFMLDSINEIDLCETTISGAFGMPLNMLRKFNSCEMVIKVLCEPYMRERAALIYKRYHTNLNRTDILEYFQFKYLNECLELDEMQDIYEPENSESHFDLEVFNCLGGFAWLEEDDEDLYEELLLCIKMWKEAKMSLGSLQDVLAPDGEWDEGGFSDSFCILRDYMDHKGEMDAKYASIYECLTRDYSYRNDKYFIDFPKKDNFAFDIICESEKMHNCLAEYVYEIVNGTATILYIRDVAHPDKSLVDVEIHDNELLQAYRAFNKELTGEQLDFLNEFIKEKGIYKDDDDGLVNEVELFTPVEDEEWNYYMDFASNLDDESLFQEDIDEQNLLQEIRAEYGGTRRNALDFTQPDFS